MNQYTKRILIPLMMVFLLLGACAPAPAATQGAGLSQQAIEQSVALTVAADSAQQKDQQLIEQAVALTVAAQNVQATQLALSATVPPTVTLVPTETAAPTAESVPLPSGSDLIPTSESVPVMDEICDPSPQGPVPHIESVSPPEGSSQGGTVVTITGENFLSGQGGITSFLFGQNAASSNNVECDETGSQCTVRTPPGVAGIVLVRAINNMDNGDTICSQHDVDNAYDGFKYNEIRYGCSVLTVTPDNWTIYESKEGFTVKWIIKNTGLSSWPAGLDFRFSSGVNMVNGGAQELPAMGPNDTYTIRLNATAPENAGNYYMSWKVEGMTCDAYVAITVE